MIKIEIGKYVEDAIDWISVEAAGFFDGITNGVDVIVEGFQGLLMAPPFWVITILFAILMYWLNARKVGLFTKDGWKSAGGIAIFTIIGLTLLNFMGYWEETMETTALVVASALIAIVIGIPLGIWAAKNNRVDQVIRPILDFMQTMPPFVYLIPAILFFSVGNVPGVVATVVFALPPAVRFTNLGIRNVQKDVVEASLAFGSNDRQMLIKVQIPLAMSTILAGINQVIMLALSMVVIASMVGAAGLGELVYQGILQADVALGFDAGLGIVILAIILDRLTQALGK